MVLSDVTKAVLRAKAAALILLRESGWAEFTEILVLSTEEPNVVKEAMSSLAEDPAYTLHNRKHRHPILTEVGVQPHDFVPGAFNEDNLLWEELARDADKLYHRLRIAHRKKLENAD